MTFLEKLDEQMKINGLNKSTLSKGCGIPYTTIDGWYKRGYEGISLNSVMILSKYFETTLDYWAEKENELSTEEYELIKAYRKNPDMHEAIKKILDL